LSSVINEMSRLQSYMQYQDRIHVLFEYENDE